MSSAQLDHAAFAETNPPGPALRLQAAERLAEHRTRRARLQQQRGLAASSGSQAAAPADTRSARIAAAVAERYAQSPSYRAFLAAEAERALQQATAAAEAATRAQTMAAAQQQLLADLEVELELRSEPFHAEPAPRIAAPLAATQAREASTVNPASAPGLTVRLYLEDGPELAGPSLVRQSVSSSTVTRPQVLDEAESLALDEEIAFRQAPVFEEPPDPPTALPANLIEFPRQLVAPRKARPRYAEGPLREDAAEPAGAGQLRIFEVEADQISPAMPEVAPVWTSIWLDAAAPSVPTGHVASTPQASGQVFGAHFSFAPHPQIAPFTRRLMASAVDGCLVILGFVAAAATFIFGSLRVTPNHLPTLPPVMILGMTGGGGLLLLALLYQVLFLSLAAATPGMRCARIALCTFRDENPTRAEMRLRALAMLVSTLPLGLGLLWAWLDQDSLTWHDRISKTYQRSY